MVQPSINNKHINHNIADVEYYHLVSDYLGERCFMVDWINNECVQVVINPGKKKKGRPHMEGVYKIAVSTFRGTYHWYYKRSNLSNTVNIYLTTEKEFKRAVLDSVIKMTNIKNK